jgi:hypothetical protein
MANITTGITTALMRPSPAPAFKHDTEGAPEFEVYDQAGNREVVRDAEAIDGIAKPRDPRHNPPASGRRAARRSR